jgi:hypothetical protein
LNCGFNFHLPFEESSFDDVGLMEIMLIVTVLFLKKLSRKEGIQMLRKLVDVRNGL